MTVEFVSKEEHDELRNTMSVMAVMLTAAINKNGELVLTDEEVDAVEDCWTVELKMDVEKGLRIFTINKGE